MKIFIAVLVILLISISSAGYAQSVSEESTKIRLPVLKNNISKGSASVPDGGLLIKGRLAKSNQESPSIEALADAAGYAGRSRDVWVKPGSRSATGKFAFARNSKFFAIFSRSFASRELELTQQQVDDIKSLEISSQDEIALLEQEQTTESDKLAAEIAEKFDKRVMEILLPHQRELLKQYLFRASVRRIGFFDAIERGFLAEELELTHKQKQLFADKAQEILKSHEKMLKDSVEELFDNFTRKQVKKLASHLGEILRKSYFQRRRVSSESFRRKSKPRSLSLPD